MEAVTVEERICIGCGKGFPATKDFFYVRRRNSRNGLYLDTRCKDCRKQVNKVYRQGYDAGQFEPKLMAHVDVPAKRLVQPLEVSEVERHRREACPEYGVCLDVAAFANWTSFSCQGCGRA